MPEPICIVHLPHASDQMPSLDGFVGDWRGEMDLLTDWGTDQLFDVPGATIIAAPCNRVFCDVERFADDEHEPMARLGMGFVYTRTDAGQPLRVVSPELRAHIHTTYWLPHHQRLARTVQDALATGRPVLLIDGHSFSDVPFRRDPDQSRPRPDLCLGTDPRWPPPAMVTAMVAVATRQGLSIAIDRPYAGTMVRSGMDQMPGSAERFASVMIEVNRRLYLDGIYPRALAVARLRSVITDHIAAAMATVHATSVWRVGGIP